MRFHSMKATLKSAVSAATVLLLGAGMAAAQQQVNLSAGPTSITLPAGQPFSLRGVRPSPEPIKTFSPQFGMAIEYYLNKVIFDCQLAAAAEAAPGAHEIIVKIHYQLCDEHTCLIPETKQLCVPIEVVTDESGKEKPAGEDLEYGGR